MLSQTDSFNKERLHNIKINHKLNRYNRQTLQQHKIRINKKIIINQRYQMFRVQQY